MLSLILSPRYSEDSIALWRAAQEEGYKVHRLQSWRVPSELEFIDNVTVYGEALFAAAVSQQLSLSLLEPHFQWLSEIPFDYKLRQVDFMTLGEASKISSKKFIKPADDKNFPAKVYKHGQEIPNLRTLSLLTPTLVSDEVNFEIEFRCFILEGELKTFSPYSVNGVLAKNLEGIWQASDNQYKAANKFITKVLRELSNTLPPAVVVDVGEITGKGWAIVEANPAWASGIYGCAPKEVLKVISRTSIKTDKLSSEDKKWVIKRE